MAVGVTLAARPKLIHVVGCDFPRTRAGMASSNRLFNPLLLAGEERVPPEEFWRPSSAVRHTFTLPFE